MAQTEIRMCWRDRCHWFHGLDRCHRRYGFHWCDRSHRRYGSHWRDRSDRRFGSHRRYGFRGATSGYGFHWTARCGFDVEQHNLSGSLSPQTHTFSRTSSFSIFLFTSTPPVVRCSLTLSHQRTSQNDTGPDELSHLINVAFGGTCAIDDTGCYLCISSTNPGLGCAVCTEGYKKVRPSLSTPLSAERSVGRRAILGTKKKQATDVPYCLGSTIKAELENDVLADAGELSAAIKSKAADSKKALSVIGSGAKASVHDLFRDQLRALEKKKSAISSLAERLAAEGEKD